MRPKTHLPTAKHKFNNFSQLSNLKRISCFSGLRYSDIYKLTWGEINIAQDGEARIETRMKKTKKVSFHVGRHTFATLTLIHDVQIDSNYVQWLNEVKSRYRSAQIKAAVKVNAEQLLFNWQLGRDLVTRKAEEQRGSGVVEQLSMDLQAAFPESKGFSTTNLWRMKQWYLFYSDALKKLPQLVEELQHAESQSNIKLAQVVGEIESTDFPPLFAYVPWGHHAEIIAKCKTIEEALFYVKKCATEGWSRNTLMNCIKAHQYENLGGAITNFADKLPSPQSELAQAITKDTYDNVKKLQEQLPSVEELKARIRLLEEQLSKEKIEKDSLSLRAKRQRYGRQQFHRLRKDILQIRKWRRRVDAFEEGEIYSEGRT